MKSPRKIISYVFSELRENYQNPDWWRSRARNRINRPVQQRLNPYDSINSVVEHDWDTLVVLDACRADLFYEALTTNDISNREENWTTKMSNASATPEWLQQNFTDSHGDIVYVSGNPMVTRKRPNSFHRLIESWRDGYSAESSIISPKAVTKDALKAHSNFQDKRIIVHYMQPHYPFIGRQDLNYADYDFSDVGLDAQSDEAEITSVWDAYQLGKVDGQDVWEAYKSNLETVFREVEELVNKTDTKTVITSDHGNMLGGRSWPVPLELYGHPRDYRTKKLLHVPWVEIEGNRKEIVTGNTSDTSIDEDVASRLSDLGYS